MKTILCAFLLCLSAVAHAGDYHLVCYTDPLTSSFDISQKADSDELLGTVIFHYGTEYAPAISGIYTPHDLPLLTERAALVKEMKPTTTFHWPKKKCLIGEQGRMECFGSEDVQDGEDGVKFTPFAIYTTRISEDGIAGKFDYLRVTLSIYAGQKNAIVEMNYPLSGCELNGVKLGERAKKGSSLRSIPSSVSR
ncbi:MAG: hypothetical protein ACXWQO_05745 [Bdellovibrionota bacterium]